jgi:choline-sulfatase
VKIWKYTRYFDNPQFWSDPGTPGSSSDVQDVVQLQKQEIGAVPGRPDCGQAACAT